MLPSGPVIEPASPLKNPATLAAPCVSPFSRPNMMCFPALIAQSGGEWMPSADRIFAGNPPNQVLTVSHTFFTPFSRPVRMSLPLPNSHVVASPILRSTDNSKFPHQISTPPAPDQTARSPSHNPWMMFFPAPTSHE